MTYAEREVARQIKEAASFTRNAKLKAAGNTCNDNAVRLHYCEMWLASLLAVARALP